MDRPSDPAGPTGNASGAERFRVRWRRGLVLGGAIGVAVGLAAAAFVAWAIGGGTAGRMALVAGVIAGAGVGTFVGGLSRLESPRPGTEPTEVERPILDEPELTKTEGHPQARR